MNIQKVIGLLLISVLCINSGCASYIVYKKSEREMYQSRIITSGDQTAMNALRVGISPSQAIKAVDIPGGMGFAVDISATEIISEHLWTQIGAALLDALLVYGAKESIDYMNSQNNDTVSTCPEPIKISIEMMESDRVIVNLY